jgi:hypothetical protein
MSWTNSSIKRISPPPSLTSKRLKSYVRSDTLI